MLFGRCRDKVWYNLAGMMACYCTMCAEIQTVYVYSSVPCKETYDGLFRGRTVDVNVGVYGDVDGKIMYIVDIFLSQIFFSIFSLDIFFLILLYVYIHLLSFFLFISSTFNNRS